MKCYRRRHSDLWAVAVVALLGAGLAQTGAGTRHPEAATASLAAPPAWSSNQDLADKMAAEWGWTGSQTVCLNELWTRESGFRTDAVNEQTGATGIPQLNPSYHQVPAGWSSAVVQIRWGLRDIRNVYGSPCSAWAHEVRSGWY